MKGNYTTILARASTARGEDHPHMKGNYTEGEFVAFEEAEKIIPI